MNVPGGAEALCCVKEGGDGAAWCPALAAGLGESRSEIAPGILLEPRRDEARRFIFPSSSETRKAILGYLLA